MKIFGSLRSPSSLYSNLFMALQKKLKILGNFSSSALHNTIAFLIKITMESPRKMW